MRWLKAPADLLHAVAAGLLTVLLLAASNPDRGVRIGDLGPPLMFALLAAVVCWLTARRITRHPPLRGPLAALLVLAVLLYGYVSAPLERVLPLGPGYSSLAVLASVTTALIWFMARVRRMRPMAPEWSRAVTAALAVMVTVSGINAARALVGKEDVAPNADPPLAPITPRFESEELPDIYLIILDAYSRSDHLREIYGYDNSGFEAELRRRGFRIPDRAIANYGATFLSMAALMNWDYLQDLAPGALEGEVERAPIYELVEDNRTVRFLKALGYQFVYLRSSYPAMASNRLADLELPEEITGQFTQLYASKTILLSLFKVYCLVSRCFESVWPFTPESPAVLSEKFQYLGEIAKHDSHRFVLAHFLLPHEPFRVDSSCAPIEPLWPSTFDESEEAKVLKLYPWQVACTNRKVLESVDRILAVADPEPIILIQADHGYGRFPWGRTGPLTETDADRVQERMAVFAAYRLPGPDAPQVPPDISPVNVFRLVLSNYFGRTDLTRIEDISWWSAWERPYDFTRVHVEPEDRGVDARPPVAATP